VPGTTTRREFIRRAAGATIGGLASAAGLAAPARAQGPDEAAAVLTPGDPAEQGIDPAGLDELRSILAEAIRSATLPGVSLLVAVRGAVVFREAHGQIEADQAVRISSSTKPVTASVVMSVVDEGRLSLDDKLGHILPEFAETRVDDATVRQLLCHSAGFSGRFPPGPPPSGGLADFSQWVAARGQLSAPGRFRYGGVGLDIAARVCEVAAGAAFEDLVQERIFDPLGMAGSAYAVGSASRDLVPLGQGRYVNAGGGMLSTLDDLAAFYQMHLNGGRYGERTILSTDSVVAMHARQAEQVVSQRPRRVAEYGLGFYRERIAENGTALTIAHGGDLGTLPWLDKDRQIVGVFLAQSSLGRAGPVQGPGPAAPAEDPADHRSGARRTDAQRRRRTATAPLSRGGKTSGVYPRFAKSTKQIGG
jgi:CubicO group peptidase (beta-lactamase class C family)